MPLKIPKLVSWITGIVILIIVGLTVSTKIEGCHDKHLIQVSQQDLAKVGSIERAADSLSYNNEIKIVKRDSAVAPIIKHSHSIIGRSEALHATIDSGVVSLPQPKRDSVLGALKSLDSLPALMQIEIDSLKQDTVDLEQTKRALLQALTVVSKDDSLYHQKYDKAIVSLHNARVNEARLVGTGVVIGVAAYLLIHFL